VQVRGHQGADLEGMLNDRQRPAGVVAPQLEDHADGTQLAGTALAWADDGQGQGSGVLWVCLVGDVVGDA
jgi:hypothetical protein